MRAPPLFVVVLTSGSGRERFFGPFGDMTVAEQWAETIDLEDFEAVDTFALEDPTTSGVAGVSRMNRRPKP